MEVKSPLTFSNNILLENSIDVKEIVKGYAQVFGIDVKNKFEGIDKVELYRCLDTQYRFFYPFTISGDGSFYEQLQSFEWYYMDWKWEHNEALKYIEKGNRVLEVGCAKGSFVGKLKELGMEAVGLELNEKASIEGRSKGLTIINETIQEHALTNQNSYDIVCSFQVMEHIANVREVLNASVDALKKGGKLIISVPNNDSFLGLDKNYLNMPPHHMGLWNKKSLLKMGEILNLKTIDILFEPLQSYHKDYFSQTIINYYSNKFPFFKMGIRKMGGGVISISEKMFSKIFKAYTVQIVFEKL